MFPAQIYIPDTKFAEQLTALMFPGALAHTCLHEFAIHSIYLPIQAINERAVYVLHVHGELGQVSNEFVRRSVSIILCKPSEYFRRLRGDQAFAFLIMHAVCYAKGDGGVESGRNYIVMVEHGSNM